MGGRFMREVHDGDPPTRTVRTRVAIGGIDQQVVAARHALDRFALIHDHHSHPGEVESEPLLQRCDVHRLMGDQIDAMVEAEHLSDAAGIGLATSGHRPEPVIDRDPQFVRGADGHRATNQGSS